MKQLSLFEFPNFTDLLWFLIQFSVTLALAFSFKVVRLGYFKIALFYFRRQ